jgi:acyl carrier protein
MTVTMSKEAIFLKLREVLAATFQLDPTVITLEANLFTDLDLDSIDAVELAIQLQDITGRRVKAEEFKGVRTVNDVVEAVHQMLQAG